MKFETHSHSYYSVGTKIIWEGLNSPAEMVKAAKKKGLGGIAITDHNSIKAWREARETAKKEGIIFIPGIEISSADGHIIGLGINDFIERDMSADETIEKIHEQGGIAIAAHPFDIKGEGLRDKCVKADAAEVFNALNVDILANKFTERKLRKLNISKVCGSDAHSVEMVGRAVNHIDADDVDSVLKQIKRGNVEIECDYVPIRVITAWAKTRMERSYGYTLKYIHENYRQPKAWLAEGLLNKYVNSKRTNFWKVLGLVSVNITRIYVGLKLLSYY